MANGDISKAVIGAADGTGITTKKTMPIGRAGSINATDARHQLSLRDHPFDLFVAEWRPRNLHAELVADCRQFSNILGCETTRLDHCQETLHSAPPTPHLPAPPLSPIK